MLYEKTGSVMAAGSNTCWCTTTATTTRASSSGSAQAVLGCAQEHMCEDGVPACQGNASQGNEQQHQQLLASKPKLTAVCGQWTSRTLQ